MDRIFYITLKGLKRWRISMVVWLLALCGVFSVNAGITINPESLKVNVEIFQPQISVLILKADNPVLQMKLTIVSEVAQVQKIAVSLNGTTCLSDIEMVSLFFTRFTGKNNNPMQFGKTVSPSAEIMFTDNVHTYRIPGLATTNSGTLLAVYDARRESVRDLQGNIDIGLSRSTDSGNTWEPMRIVLDRGTWGGLPEKSYEGSKPCSAIREGNYKLIYF